MNALTDRIRSSRAIIVAAICLACWPVARWYLARLNDGSDEPWGLAALAAAIVFAPRDGWTESLTTTKIRLLFGLLATYTLTFHLSPPLAHALLFVTIIGLAAGKQTFPLAWWSLLVLSLPVIATLQFYIGFPLRLATTQLCIPILRLGGLHVTAEETALHWAGETVIVDAPCSGIHMLWTGLFLAAVIACWRRLEPRSAFRLLRSASLTVFVANVLRAAALFCIETKIWPSPPWAHEAAGLTLFGFAAIAIYLTSTSTVPIPKTEAFLS